MDNSFFTDKNQVPTEDELKMALGSTYSLWNHLREYVHSLYPAVTDEWGFPGAKYGWSYRVKDSKRVILYLLPRDGYFKAAFNFGNKASEAILNSTISEKIRKDLGEARVYAEGRGIRIDVKDESLLNDIELLIRAKISIR